MKWYRSRQWSGRHRQRPVTGTRTLTCSSKPSSSTRRTNQTVAKVVRKVFGTQLSNESQKVTAKDFKAAIDKLGTDMQAFIK